MERLATYGAMKLTRYLKTRRGEAYFKKYASLLCCELVEEMWDELNDKPEILFEETETDREKLAKCAYAGIYYMVMGNPLVMTALQLAVYAYMNHAVLEVFADICPECMDGVTIELAAKLVYDEDFVLPYYPECSIAAEMCRYLFPDAKMDSDLFHAPLTADARLIQHLTGLSVPDKRLGLMTEVFEPDMEQMKEWYALNPATEHEIEMTEKRLSEKTNICIHISGETKSGRRFTAKHIANKQGLPLLLVDYERLEHKNSSFFPLWKIILRELFLTDKCLCIYHISCSEEEQKALILMLKYIEKEYMPFEKPLFLLSQPNVKLLPFLETELHEISLKNCDSQQSQHLWELFLKRYGIEGIVNSRELAAKMNLPVAQMQQVASLTAKQIRQQGYQENDIYRICYRVLDDGRYDNIKRIEMDYDWNDLKVDAQQKEVLKRICSQVTYRTVVLDDWGLRNNYQYGRGVSAIFTGPPGTGKTMAANIIARKLGLEIYKVDLSQIVDKYIGETEKRLEEVFARAEKSHMVLFFDEADSILGKRSEVKESKDKYANTEVSYLLQRMEEYDGIVLMATNNRMNIDPAFIRRFRFEVSFHMPSKEQRRNIWDMLLQETIPKQAIDTDYLADVFEISGAEIKNILLNACFDAAAGTGELTMKEVILSACSELKKNGKLLLAKDLKQYAEILEKNEI